jgi:hypothetical protein
MISQQLPIDADRAEAIADLLDGLSGELIEAAQVLRQEASHE